MLQPDNDLLHQHLLLCAVQDADQANLGAFYDHYSPILYGMILRANADQAQASLILTETFKNIFCSTHKYDPKKLRVLIWMMQICQQEINKVMVSKLSGRANDDVVFKAMQITKISNASGAGADSAA